MGVGVFSSSEDEKEGGASDVSRAGGYVLRVAGSLDVAGHVDHLIQDIPMVNESGSSAKIPRGL